MECDKTKANLDLITTLTTGKYQLPLGKQSQINSTIVENS